ncbi:MAG: hypothetical protein D6785_15890 [Planctomycetota bacterium]|nr:MAG: hypothetical protein D6785_15890 [Planctomycetota bacterium]
MGFFRDLFSKKVTSETLKAALEGVEKNRKERHLELKKLSIRQNRLVDQAKEARKKRREVELDGLWQEIKHLRMEIGIVQREIKKLNLEAIGLKRYIWGLERLEKENNREGIRTLLNRIRSSKLDVKLAAHDLKEREYLEELAMTLEEAGLGFEWEDIEEEDPLKEGFLKNLDSIIEAEEAGDKEKAKEKEELLKLRLEEGGEDELLMEEEERKEMET